MIINRRSFSDFLASHFAGKIQKLTINAGFNCPNRDGTLGRGGCIYCNNSSFTPATATGTVAEQIAAGKRFFARKYPSMRYLAYFQSYTPTNAPVSILMKLFREALVQQDVVGIAIGTRPDCMPSSLLDELKALSHDTFVMIEYGAESSHDITLAKINRCHTWATTIDAVSRTADAGIPVGLHLINGLPGETLQMMLQTVDAVNELPIDVVKFHQMQVVRGTELARRWQQGTADIYDFSLDDYLRLCVQILDRLRDDIAIERFVSQSPDGMLLYPRWGLKNYQFMHALAAIVAARASH